MDKTLRCELAELVWAYRTIDMTEAEFLDAVDRNDFIYWDKEIRVQFKKAVEDGIVTFDKVCRVFLGHDEDDIHFENPNGIVWTLRDIVQDYLISKTVETEDDVGYGDVMERNIDYIVIEPKENR